MDRTAIAELVTKNIKRTVIDLREGEIDPLAPLIELGATSVDLVEVVSTSMRQLRIKVPRTAFANEPSLGDLVDLLHRIYVETHGEPQVEAAAARGLDR